MERVYKTMKVTGAGCIAAGVVILAVSYTHLTLPTKLVV